MGPCQAVWCDFALLAILAVMVRARRSVAAVRTRGFDRQAVPSGSINYRCAVDHFSHHLQSPA